jgi:hypothetical protein
MMIWWVWWRSVLVHWLHCHVQRDRAIRVSSAYVMPIGNGYMTKRFRLDELGQRSVLHPPMFQYILVDRLIP